MCVLSSSILVYFTSAFYRTHPWTMIDMIRLRYTSWRRSSRPSPSFLPSREKSLFQRPFPILPSSGSSALSGLVRDRLEKTNHHLIVWYRFGRVGFLGASGGMGSCASAPPRHLGTTRCRMPARKYPPNAFTSRHERQFISFSHVCDSTWVLFLNFCIHKHDDDEVTGD